MPEAFLTWVDTGSTSPKEPYTNSKLIHTLALAENRPEEVNTNELQNMIDKTSRRLKEVMSRQAGQSKKLRSITNKGACN